MTLYALKPRFQALLRPLVLRLAAAGVTANQVTVSAAAGSVLLGGLIAWQAGVSPEIFVLLAPWLLLRMALNAVDGMLAREHGQRSRLGALLNELGDVVSDAALYAPFALLLPFGPGGIGAVVLLSTLSEFTGVLGPAIGASRRYDGPFGKSDRALLFGALGLWAGLAGGLPGWLWPLPSLLSLLLLLTIVRRARGALAENPA
ncbi:CDP-alcohol phosphatidyltransferase family protein [Roseomonas sp. KE2513]|uniref:CDP-alcohol phosphatidyltransferase family protein n=1 Tax=Roseomonas sp. KE2513 TaxID=2479202 RepID=UPI0018DF4BD3|nr:CDP-alcohol phosphatidyltransferase family protein [Roseomonas sp. KE2513]MBI0539528.1 CDP-alcohol phosphatidyltransferase family protein [Roseomonas sp. KE2513]